MDADIEGAIIRLKRERNAVLLAHYYQDSEIQDVADVIGDSLQLARTAAETTADVICFAGVHFMAETAKILNPTRTVILPDLNAGCSLANGCPADRFAQWVDNCRKHAPNNDVTVVSYINCTAEVKALSDIICTSSNAVRVIESIPESSTILFAPDKNLGMWVRKKTGRPMVFWQGTCIVHETFSQRKLIGLKTQYPGAQVIAHPECEPAVLDMADFVGSTTALLSYAVASSWDQFIVVTESGILHQMQKEAPEKTFIPAPPDGNCACNECPYMKMNTLEKVYACLRDLSPRIEMDPALLARARVPIDRMMAISV
jgi:quinolinate synthase